MKPHIIHLPLVAAFLLAAVTLSCASQPPGTPASNNPAVYSQDSLPLDAAIGQIASYFTGRLAPRSSIALVNFEAETRTLSDYIFEEFWIYFEDNSSLLLVDRRNLELINKEISYQVSGEVSDASAASIGQQFGPKTLMYGKITRIGGEYRLTVYATDIEHATSGVRAVNIRPDNRLAALLEKPTDESAAVNMAKVLYAGVGNPFRFTVQTDKANGDYQDGDYMTLRIYSEQDAYFKVSHIDVHGNIQVIYPVSSRDNNFIGAGQTRHIPDNTRFRMTQPYGQEIILVAAYDVPFTIGRQNTSAPLSSYAVTRGLTLENAETQTTMPPVATAKVTYTRRFDNEGPQHQVTVSSFYMGKYEVTQREWAAVMGSNPSYFKGDDLPVENVSWYDAIDYCNRRSQREGLTPAYTRNGDNVTWNRGANGYRLPTEAEWEYACRAGTTTAYNSGNNITTNQAKYYYEESTTKNVGSFSPNVWGLYDMHGNVWEWCWDWYGNYASGAQTGPAGAASGSDRVRRGGSLSNGAQNLRSAIRYYSAPSHRGGDLGFRLVRNVE